MRWNMDYVRNNLPEIAGMYNRIPSYDPNARAAWEQLAKESKQHADFIHQNMDVDYVDDPEPYATPEEMFHDIKNNGHISISTANSEHPVWNPEQNADFRLVHDVFGHAVTGGDFGWHGENQACSPHHAISSPLAAQALTTECLGQTGAAIHNGGFGEQKVGFLPIHNQLVQANRGRMQPTPQALMRAALAPLDQSVKWKRSSSASSDYCYRHSYHPEHKGQTFRNGLKRTFDDEEGKRQLIRDEMGPADTGHSRPDRQVENYWTELPAAMKNSNWKFSTPHGLKTIFTQSNPYKLWGKLDGSDYSEEFDPSRHDHMFYLDENDSPVGYIKWDDYSKSKDEANTNISYLGFADTDGDMLFPDREGGGVDDRYNTLRAKYPLMALHGMRWIKNNLPGPYSAYFVNPKLKKTLHGEDDGRFEHVIRHPSVYSKWKISSFDYYEQLVNWATRLLSGEQLPQEEWTKLSDLLGVIMQFNLNNYSDPFQRDVKADMRKVIGHMLDGQFIEAGRLLFSIVQDMKKEHDPAYSESKLYGNPEQGTVEEITRPERRQQLLNKWPVISKWKVAKVPVLDQTFGQENQDKLAMLNHYPGVENLSPTQVPTMWVYHPEDNVVIFGHRGEHQGHGWMANKVYNNPGMEMNDTDTYFSDHLYPRGTISYTRDSTTVTGYDNGIVEVFGGNSVDPKAMDNALADVSSILSYVGFPNVKTAIGWGSEGYTPEPKPQRQPLDTRSLLRNQPKMWDPELDHETPAFKQFHSKWKISHWLRGYYAAAMQPHPEGGWHFSWADPNHKHPVTGRPTFGGSDADLTNHEDLTDIAATNYNRENGLDPNNYKDYQKAMHPSTQDQMYRGLYNPETQHLVHITSPSEWIGYRDPEQGGYTEKNETGFNAQDENIWREAAQKAGVPVQDFHFAQFGQSATPWAYESERYNPDVNFLTPQNVMQIKPQQIQMPYQPGLMQKMKDNTFNFWDPEKAHETQAWKQYALKNSKWKISHWIPGYHAAILGEDMNTGRHHMRIAPEWRDSHGTPWNSLIRENPDITFGNFGWRGLYHPKKKHLIHMSDPEEYEHADFWTEYAPSGWEAPTEHADIWHGAAKRAGIPVDRFSFLRGVNDPNEEGTNTPWSKTQDNKWDFVDMTPQNLEMPYQPGLMRKMKENVFNYPDPDRHPETEAWRRHLLRNSKWKLSSNFDIVRKSTSEVRNKWQRQ